MISFSVPEWYENRKLRGDACSIDANIILFILGYYSWLFYEENTIEGKTYPTLLKFIWRWVLAFNGKHAFSDTLTYINGNGLNNYYTRAVKVDIVRLSSELNKFMLWYKVYWHETTLPIPIIMAKYDTLKCWIIIAMAFIKLWNMACGKIHILATQLIYLFFVRSRCYDESSTRDYCTCHITHCWVPLGCPSKIQKVTLGRKVGSLRMRNVFKGKMYKNRSMFGMKHDIVRLII